MVGSLHVSGQSRRTLLSFCSLVVENFTALLGKNAGRDSKPSTFREARKRSEKQQVTNSSGEKKRER
jgi:hypothetical protein